MSEEKTASAGSTKVTKVKATSMVADKQVYCGPTIRGVAKQYTVFENGLPAKLAELAEQKPVLKALIVPVSKFATTRERVERVGTAESILFAKAAAALKK